jgi:hypothetical protein
MMPSTKISIQDESPCVQVAACFIIPPREATARQSQHRFSPHCSMLFITCHALYGPRYKSPWGERQRSMRTAVHPASRNSCSQFSGIGLFPIWERHFAFPIPPSKPKAAKSRYRFCDGASHSPAVPDNGVALAIAANVYAHDRCPSPQPAVSHNVEAISGLNASGLAVARVPSPFFPCVGFASSIAFGNPLFPEVFRAGSNEISHVSPALWNTDLPEQIPQTVPASAPCALRSVDRDYSALNQSLD